jgi:LysM repeat protein
MKSLSILALIGLTTLLIGCSSTDEKKSQAGNDLPVPATAGNSQMETTPVAPAATTTTTTAAAPAASTANVATVDYTVVSGDSLWKIARDHKTSVAKLKALNSLPNDKLMPGQVIKVPAAQ